MFLVNKYGFTYLSYKALYSLQTLKMFLFFRILDPFMHFLFFATLTSAIAGKKYLAYVVLGNIVYYTGQTMMINFMSMFRAERRFGTLELNIAAPLSTFVIILKKAVVPFLDGLFVFAIGLLIGRILFNIPLESKQFLNLLLLFMIAIFSILSFSLLFACLSLMFANPNLYLNLSMAIFQVFCGVNFSVDLLPASIKWISDILPLTHSIKAIRTIYNMEVQPLYPLLMEEMMIGFVYLVFAGIMITLMEKVARKRGSLFKDI